MPTPGGVLRPEILLLAALLTCSAGCRRNAAVRSNLNINVGGRQIQAVIDGSAFISSQDDMAVISFDRHKLVVEKDRVVLDGTEQARLPAGTRGIEVSYLRGRLAVSADGKPLTMPAG